MIAVVSDPDKPLRAALEDRVRFETLVADLSSRFGTWSPSGRRRDPGRPEADREALDLDRSTLFRWMRTAPHALHSSPNAVKRPEFPRRHPDISADLFPWTVAKILRGELVCTSRNEDLPSDSPTGTDDRIGTKSNVTVALKVSGKVVGALAFGAMRHERSWPPEIVNRLILLGQVFANALARKQADTDLRSALAENARLRDQLAQENVYLQQEVKVLHGASEWGPERGDQEVLAMTGRPRELDGPAARRNRYRQELPRPPFTSDPPTPARVVRSTALQFPALIEIEALRTGEGAYTGALAKRSQFEWPTALHFSRRNR